jgi:hypothetical protein
VRAVGAVCCESCPNSKHTTFRPPHPLTNWEAAAKPSSYTTAKKNLSALLKGPSSCQHSDPQDQKKEKRKKKRKRETESLHVPPTVCRTHPSHDIRGDGGLDGFICTSRDVEIVSDCPSVVSPMTSSHCGADIGNTQWANYAHSSATRLQFSLSLTRDVLKNKFVGS